MISFTAREMLTYFGHELPSNWCCMFHAGKKMKVIDLRMKYT